jgi:hypothetical protein
MTTNRMTAAERNELKTLVNERARLAMTQVRSLRAAHQIDTWKLETRTNLVREGLTSDAAMSFLESMPGAADLLPAITADDLTRALSAR